MLWTMRTLSRFGGPLLMVVGLIWLGQGIGLIPGSFMTGSAFWATVGVAAIVVGGWISRQGWRDGS
jgi:hypothetical protein